MQALGKLVFIAICNCGYSPVEKVTSPSPILTPTVEKRRNLPKEPISKGQSQDFS